MSERSAEISDAIAKIIDVRDAPEVVLDALFHCTAFTLTLVCPACRARLAALISRELLETAEQFARECSDLEPIDCPHPRLH